MVTINYQVFGTKGFQLRLRFYCNGETKYINVTKMLKGAIQRRHWSAKRQYFLQSCPFADENNEVISNFRRKYDERALDWEGSLQGFMASFGEEKSDLKIDTLSSLISYIIAEKKKSKHEDGTIKGTYECYEKLEKRLKEYCEQERVGYDRIMVSDITVSFVNNIFDWVVKKKNGRGLAYISVTLHAVMVVADKLGLYDFSKLDGCQWKKKNRKSVNKYRTLTEEQCRMLASMPVSDLPRNPRRELYRDFSVFLLYTGQSPCDAISLRYDDIVVIDGVEHFIFKRRKIAERQYVPCSIPINDEMRRIMKRWRKQSRDGYIFPIRNKYKLATQTTNNGDIKHFVGRLNLWLKKVAVVLGCDFSLHSYTLRHTAITNYLSKGVPVVYVANLMGTSVKNCEQIYYNNQGDVKSRNLVMGISF